MKKSKKIAGVAVACALAATVAIGGTLAYLTAQSDTITNTFTVGNVKIALTEKGAIGEDGALSQDFKMIPGQTIEKTATATVNAGSEECYLFVKAEKSSNFGDYLEAKLTNEWEQLEGDIYYRVVPASQEDQSFAVLDPVKEGQAATVQVKPTVTQDMMNALQGENAQPLPTLTFKAYAVQKAGFDTAQAAWDATFGAPKQPTE